MLVRRSICLVSCLVLAGCTFFYTWTFVNDLLSGPSSDRSRLLAEDVLLSACGSVRGAMLSFLEVHEDKPRATFERNAMGHLCPKFEQLQASFDNSTTPVQHTDICESLAGKRVTMIGGEHIYRLHVLLLQHREHAEQKPFPCPYHEFCTHHHICLPYHHLQDDAPTPRYIKPPTTRELFETESAAVNYIVSDTLFSAPNESSWEYTLPFLDPMTGVRLREAYWLAAARKANVVVLGRGPLSAPGQTYTGNWSFLRHMPDYVGQSRAAIISEYEDDDEPTYHMVPGSLEILNAAVHLTVSRFLPDLSQLLQSIRREVRPSRMKWLIWPSSWYRLPGRGAARTALLHPHPRSNVQDATQRTFLHDRSDPSSAEYVLASQLSACINADATNTAHLEDPWTLLFNAQVYLQNMLLREILPCYGIVFLPLDLPWIEGAQIRGRGYGYSRGAIDVDLERTMAIGDAFLAGVDCVLRYLE